MKADDRFEISATTTELERECPSEAVADCRHPGRVCSLLAEQDVEPRLRDVDDTRGIGSELAQAVHHLGTVREVSTAAVVVEREGDEPELRESVCPGQLDVVEPRALMGDEHGWTEFVPGRYGEPAEHARAVGVVFDWGCLHRWRHLSVQVVCATASRAVATRRRVRKW